LAAQKQDRQSRAPEIIILCVSILIVLTIGGLSGVSSATSAKASAELSLAREIGKLNSALLSTVKDAETGQRGSLLTGRQQYLEPYNQATSATPSLLKRLEALTEMVPDQAQRLNSIKPLVAEKLNELQQTIDLRRSRNIAHALQVVDAGRGKAVMDRLRSICAVVDRVADERSAQLTSVTDLNSSRLRQAGTVGSAGCLRSLFSPPPQFSAG
jgi:CHASE3 domain sensor protein